MSIFDYTFNGSIYEMAANAGPVGKAVLLVLALFSIISWGIVIKKFRVIGIAKKETEKFYETYSKKGNLANIYSVGKNFKNSPAAKLFVAGYNELAANVKTPSPDGQTTEGKKVVIDNLDGISRSLSKTTLQEITRLEKAITFLATTGSTTPFIGLFGTVWGGYDILSRYWGKRLGKHSGCRPGYRRGFNRHCCRSCGGSPCRHIL